MLLTEEQCAEIRVYIFDVPRYRETYDEIYDHILNSMASKEGDFDLELVREIIDEDFGGFSQIVKQEALYQKQITSKYRKMLWSEMYAGTFHFPEALKNLGLLFICYMIYDYSLTNEVNVKVFYQALLIAVTIPGVIYLVKRFIIDRNRLKLSIKYDFMHQAWILGFLLMNSMITLTLIDGAAFEISKAAKVLVILTLYFVTSIYIRSFMRLCVKKMQILTV
ncbi:hypothetical protein [Pedobacter metabolipauper]|uniref:Uncharacterized protein n=1 Tax=Pedobacter metabolipauper TaxID=425513 RepID=A0A4R6T177_9SPHI|nr:hypothetical protein [Pedobacter metabolipauper]TDQ11809.1 hypothetical protein ATK78_0938 [Pedobacter metabolipauper]